MAASKTLTPAERSMRGRLGAYAVHAAGKTNTGPAREAFNARFERAVDPEGVLPAEERTRRAAYARKRYFTDLALRSAKARRARKAAHDNCFGFCGADLDGRVPCRDCWHATGSPETAP